MTEKILITGNTRALAEGRTRYVMHPATAVTKDLLEEVGYKVDLRWTVPGEDLSEYSAVIVGLYKTVGYVAIGTYPLLDTIRRAAIEEIPMAFLLDDHAVKTIYSGVSTMLNTTPIRPLGWEHEMWAKEHVDELREVLTWMRDRPWPATLTPLSPTVNVKPENWAKLMHRFPTNQVLGFYPDAASIHKIPRSRVRFEDREMAWTHGSLQPGAHGWLDKQEPSWPVYSFGTSAHPKVDDIDVVRTMGRTWGTIAGAQYHAGSGWWRTRYSYAALQETILIAHPEDLAAIGGPYAGLTVREVEGLSRAELELLAHKQAEWYFSILPSRDREIERMQKYINAIRNRSQVGKDGSWIGGFGR